MDTLKIENKVLHLGPIAGSGANPRDGRLLAGGPAPLRCRPQGPVEHGHFDQEVLAASSCAEALHMPAPAAGLRVGGSQRVGIDAARSLVHEDAFQRAEPIPCPKGAEIAHVDPPLGIENEERTRVTMHVALVLQHAKPT
jgi:hypothetical protein